MAVICGIPIGSIQQFRNSDI